MILKRKQIALPLSFPASCYSMGIMVSKVYEALVEAGASEAKAKAAAEAIPAIEQVATKPDIANLKAEVFKALWIQGAGIVGLVVGLTKLL